MNRLTKTFREKSERCTTGSPKSDVKSVKSTLRSAEFREFSPLPWPHWTRCAAIILAASLALANIANAAESLKIQPAHALPNYTKLNLGTNTSSGFLGFGFILACGDFNEDGRMDAAIMLRMSGFPRGVSIQLQRADGTFATKAEYALPNTGIIWEFLTADFNEDGHLDILVPDLGNDLILLLGNGDGTFQAPHFLGLAASAFPVAADLNGDGHLDLAVGTQDGTVDVFAGSGDGTFTRLATLNTLISAVHPRRGQIMIGDLNRDGKPDVAVAAAIDTSGAGSLDVFLGNGDGTFQDVIQTPGVAVWKGALGDFNGDGILDFAGDRDAPKQVEIWLGKGDGRFTNRSAYRLNFDVADVVQVADLNDDGILDLAISGQAAPNVNVAPLSIFLGNGDGTFQPRQVFMPLDNGYIYNAGPRLVDLNGDGRLDIVSMPIFWTTNPDVFGPTVFGAALSRGIKADPNLGYLVKVRNSAPDATATIAMETSTNLMDWQPLATDVATVATWSVVDTSATGQSQRFYRTRRQ